MRQRCCLCVNGPSVFAGIGVAQDTEPFCIGGHDAVLNPVMNHLDEMTRAIVAAMQIAELGRTVKFLSPWCARDFASAWRQRAEDGIEMPDDLRLASDHHAVAPFQAPDSPAG